MTRFAFAGFRVKSTRIAMFLWTIAIAAAIFHGGDVESIGLIALMFTILIVKDHRQRTGQNLEHRLSMSAQCSRPELLSEQIAHEIAIALSTVFSAALLTGHMRNPGAMACAAVIVGAGIVNECVRHYCQLEPSCGAETRRRDPPGSSGGQSGQSGQSAGGTGTGPSTPA